MARSISSLAKTILGETVTAQKQATVAKFKKIVSKMLTSTASQKLPRSLGTSRRPFVSPVKRAMRSAIVVGNKGQDALTQLLHGDPTGTCQQAAYQNAEPDLNLVEPGTVFGSVDQAKAMARVGEKGGTRAHAGEMTAFASSRPGLPGCHTARPPDAPRSLIGEC